MRKSHHATLELCMMCICVLVLICKCYKKLTRRPSFLADRLDWCGPGSEKLSVSPPAVASQRHVSSMSSYYMLVRVAPLVQSRHCMSNRILSPCTIRWPSHIHEAAKLRPHGSSPLGGMVWGGHTSMRFASFTCLCESREASNVSNG